MSASMKMAVAKVRHDYIRRTLGEDAWHQATSLLPEEERSILETGEAGMAPASVEGRLMTALSSASFGNDRAAFESYLRAGGKSQADAMLEGIFSVFARFASPQQAIKRAPSIFSSVYTGTSAESDVNAETKTGRLIVRGLGEYTFVSPWLSGWMERAIERFGGGDPVVRERSWEQGHNGSDELVFEVRWR